MKVLVLNAGSSSLKYQLINMADNHVLAEGLVERIGQSVGKLKYKTTEKYEEERPFPNHETALVRVSELLQDEKMGVIKDANEIEACGHRTVHGGEEFNHSILIDDAVLSTMKKCIPLAPLHNPANITGIEVAASIFPKAKHVGVFDTAFHQSMPAKAYKYAIPAKFYEEDHIRRYGFHGTSHLFVSREAATMLGKEQKDVNVITVHIGNGASIAAVKGGKSIDTTMGMTPLAGLVMGTRCGDIDPAIPYFLCKNKDLTIDEVDQILNKESGMYGLTGNSDLRDIEDKFIAGDAVCTEAMEIYAYSIKKAVGSYFAALGTVDAIVFTAGVGENSDIVRKMVCSDMSGLGIEIDESKNEGRKTNNIEVSSESSRVKIFVIPTNEELEIANQTIEVLKNL
ncbi:MAG: acetate kinase [Bacteriovoracaceae bacterium]|nr:acetate kinase [Bacteriovoracaceae bacterium]